MTFRNWGVAFVCCVVIPLFCSGAVMVADLTLSGRRESWRDQIERRLEALECPYESTD